MFQLSTNKYSRWYVRFWWC